MYKLLLALIAVSVCGVTAVRADSAAAPSAPEPTTVERAQAIRFALNARSRHAGSTLLVTEATSTAVVASFTLLTANLQETRVVPADNGIYFAICPRSAACPYPDRRLGRPASDFHPRRVALELALRTFLETSAAVVAVSLPTPRSFTVLVVEREALMRDVDIPGLVSALRRHTGHGSASWPRRIVDRVTRPLVFVFLGLEPTQGERETFTAVPRWPDLDVEDRR